MSLASQEEVLHQSKLLLNWAAQALDNGPFSQRQKGTHHRTFEEVLKSVLEGFPDNPHLGFQMGRYFAAGLEELAHQYERNGGVWTGIEQLTTVPPREEVRCFGWSRFSTTRTTTLLQGGEDLPDKLLLLYKRTTSPPVGYATGLRSGSSRANANGRESFNFQRPWLDDWMTYDFLLQAIQAPGSHLVAQAYHQNCEYGRLVRLCFFSFFQITT